MQPRSFEDEDEDEDENEVSGVDRLNR